MVETLSELLENAANVAEDNGGKLSIASAAVLILILKDYVCKICKR